MKWYPYLEVMAKRPQAIKYTRFFNELPLMWKNYLESQEVPVILITRQGVQIDRNAVQIIPKHCPDVTGMGVRMLPEWVSGCSRNTQIVLGASLDKAYSDERNLFLQWLKKRRPRDKQRLYLIGDKLYGVSTEAIKEVMEKGWIPVVKVEESLHRGIRDELRKIALKSYTIHQEIYKKRCLIESFFGTTKGIMVSYLEEHTEKMAFHVVFAKLALWNIGNTLFILFITLKYRKNFQTVSRT